MSTDLGTRQRDKVQVTQIERHADKIMIPENMSIREAIKQLIAHEEHMNQEVALQRTFQTFPWDGAAALQRVFERIYGWVPAKSIPGFFGSTPPRTISIEVGYQKKAQVPWGRFAIPGVEGWVQTGTSEEDGRIVFCLHASVKRAFEQDIENLFNDVEMELRQHSIYQGQAIRIRFNSDDGDKLDMPAVNFMPTDVDPDSLIFSRDLEAAIETNLITPITRIPDCIDNGIPIKRGVLLGGPYGTGKTLAAAVAAVRATENKVTYLYVPRADELAQAVNFARQYADPACVIFCEDIDRVMHGERSIEMDDILNVIDGIDGKNSRIMVVLTTNFLDNINPAMLRPGRLDAVINMTPPDAEAVERLLRAVGGAKIDDDTDLTEVGKELEGQIPAVLTEVVKRASLAELRRLPKGAKVTKLSADSLLEAARTMAQQLDLLKTKAKDPEPQVDRGIRGIVSQLVPTQDQLRDMISHELKSVRAAVGAE